jgi:hypothetical protein
MQSLPLRIMSKRRKQSSGTFVVDGSPKPLAAPLSDDERVLTDIRALIAASRGYTAQAINSAMVITYWSTENA